MQYFCLAALDENILRGSTANVKENSDLSLVFVLFILMMKLD